jgi:signal transduction histidine kinase
MRRLASLVEWPWRTLLPQAARGGTELVASLGRATVPQEVAAEEQAHVAGNLRLLLRVGFLGAALAAGANAASGRLLNAAPLAFLCGVLPFTLWLLRRGKAQLAAVLALGSMIAAVHVMLLLGGEGIHHRAVLVYPVIILMAALLLDLRLLVATTALCTLSVAVAVRLEDSGVLRTPYAGRLGWVPIVDMAIVFVVIAVAVHLLVADVVRGMIEARARGRSLADANRELEARTAELERFTYVISHDLKSPLVTIRGFLGYLERDAREGDTKRLEADVARIRSATDRMGRLLEDLLELSRSGRIARPHVEVPFLDVVREAWALVEGRLGLRGVRVEVEGPLPVVRGDPQRLVELVQNLLDNAAKFMGDESEPRVWIGSRAQPDGECVLFVRDNGIGIAPAHQQRVFELFQRLDPHVEGTGLGLALARRIVETHGGRIWVESEGAGCGSTFCFTLPGVSAAEAKAPAAAVGQSA